MKCPSCHHSETRVTDTRTERQGMSVRRRRVCEQCDYRFTTHERILTSSLEVMKRNGQKEPYNEQKLQDSIAMACGKRPVSLENVREIVLSVTDRHSGKDLVSSEEIGQDVMEALRGLDEVAYIRFASVYRSFADVSDFRNAMNSLIDSSAIDQGQKRTNLSPPS